MNHQTPEAKRCFDKAALYWNDFTPEQKAHFERLLAKDQREVHAARCEVRKVKNAVEGASYV